MPSNRLNSLDRIGLSRSQIRFEPCISRRYINCATAFDNRHCAKLIEGREGRIQQNDSLVGYDRVVHSRLNSILQLKYGLPSKRAYIGAIDRMNDTIYEGVSELTSVDRNSITDRITRSSRDEFNPDMGRLTREVLNQHIARPAHVNEQVTVDILRALIVCGNSLGDRYHRFLFAFEAEASRSRSIYIRPVLYVETKITGIGDKGGVKLHHEPGIFPLRVHITMLPVECHCIGASITGSLRCIETQRNILIRFNAYVQGNRILRDEAMEQAIDILRSCTGDIVLISGSFDSAVNQLANRLRTMIVLTALIDRTFTNRHCAGHRILEGSSSFDRSRTIQFILQRRSIYVDVVVLDIRDTYLIPVRLVVARKRILYVRNEELSLLLCCIRSDRSVLAVELRLEYERVRRTNLDVKFYITDTVNSLCRYIMRFRFALLEGSLAAIHEQVIFLLIFCFVTIVNGYFHFRSTHTGVLTDHVQYLVVQVFILLQVSRLHLIPHLGVRRLGIERIQTNRKCILRIVTAKCLHEFSTELEVTGTALADDADDDRIFLQHLVERSYRNGIGEVLISFQFFRLRHHRLGDRECKCSLSRDGLCRIRSIDQVSYRCHFFSDITNVIDLRLRNDIPSGILRLGIDAIPVEGIDMVDFRSIDRIERSRSDLIGPEAEGSRSLDVYINHTIGH